MTTRTAKIEFVMAELFRQGHEWTIEMQDAAADAVEVADSKDTARKIARKIIAVLTA